MSMWNDFGTFVANLATDAFSAIVEAVRTVFAGDPETRKQVSFSIAMIALSAKMAKADGIVTEDEVATFQSMFTVPEGEFENVARVYNLAKEDVAGYDSYAHQVRALFPDDKDILRDVIDGLFHIAKADGALHENEFLFLEDVAGIFGFDATTFARIKSRHVSPEASDPYVVLDADPAWDYATLRKQYIKRVQEAHPDRLMARGVPPEFVSIANDRLAAINAAWEMIERERAA